MAYTASDAFCAQTDVESVVQRGVFDTTTKPTAQQVLDWMARYAAEVEDHLAKSGSGYTVTNRGNPFPGSPTGTIARLKLLCEAANAIGAASQVIAMHSVLGGAGSADAAKAMYDRFVEMLKQIDVAAVIAVSGASVFSRTDTTDLAFTSDTEF